MSQLEVVTAICTAGHRRVPEFTVGPDQTLNAALVPLSISATDRGLRRGNVPVPGDNNKKAQGHPEPFRVLSRHDDGSWRLVEITIATTNCTAGDLESLRQSHGEYDPVSSTALA